MFESSFHWLLPFLHCLCLSSSAGLNESVVLTISAVSLTVCVTLMQCCDYKSHIRWTRCVCGASHFSVNSGAEAPAHCVAHCSFKFCISLPDVFLISSLCLPVFRSQRSLCNFNCLPHTSSSEFIRFIRFEHWLMSYGTIHWLVN